MTLGDAAGTAAPAGAEAEPDLVRETSSLGLFVRTKSTVPVAPVMDATVAVTA